MYVCTYPCLCIYSCVLVCLSARVCGSPRHSLVCSVFRSALGILPAEVVLAATVPAVGTTEPAGAATAITASTVMARMATQVQAAGAATQVERVGRLMLVAAVATAMWAAAVAMAWRSAWQRIELCAGIRFCLQTSCLLRVQLQLDAGCESVVKHSA